MGLKSMRGEKPRIRDIFKGFDRFWGTCFLWLIVPAGIFIFVSTGAGVLLGSASLGNSDAGVSTFD